MKFFLTIPNVSKQLSSRIRRLCAISVQIVQVIAGRSQNLQTINYLTTNTAILLDSQFFGSGCAYFFFSDLPLNSLSPDGVAQIFSKLYLKRHAIEQLPSQDQIGFLSAISSLATVQYCPVSVMHKTIDYLISQLLSMVKIDGETQKSSAESCDKRLSDRKNVCEHSYEMISFVIKLHPSLTSYLINQVELSHNRINGLNSKNDSMGTINSALNTVFTTGSDILLTGNSITENLTGMLNPVDNSQNLLSTILPRIFETLNSDSLAYWDATVEDLYQLKSWLFSKNETKVFMATTIFKKYRVIFLKYRFLGKTSNFWVKERYLRSFLGQNMPFQVIFLVKTRYLRSFLGQNASF